MSVLLWILGVLIILFYFLLRPGRYSQEQLEMVKGVNFAHRGLHNEEKTVPENSIAAFALAANAGYGIELDIQLSSDGEVVVFHDDTLERVTGVNGRVDAYTFAELHNMHLCDTDQNIPLFTEVLSVINCRVPIIVELKTGPRNDELCAKGLAILQSYQGPYCIESFDPRIVHYFRKNAPQILRGQLSDASKNFKDKPLILKLALGNLFTDFIARPQFIAYGDGKKSVFVRLAEAMGAIKICWTVRPTSDIAAKEAENDAVIFEKYTPETNYLKP
ncbi:MAG: glycerophosphodiester phosphodiesterase family protein [Oscillospiraceae bacterium]